MAIADNRMKQTMVAGNLATSLNVSRWNGVEIAEIARIAGFEWLFVDLEHGMLGVEQAAQIATLGISIGVTPIARVGMGQYALASRLLDGGMQGIVFPHIDGPEEARAAVEATKYPPLGKRSLGGPLAQAGFRPSFDPASLAAINRQTLTIVMIETGTAVRAAQAIAAVAGVDGVLIGTNDLAADYGVPGDLGNEKIRAAYEIVGQACRASDRFFGMGGVYRQDLIARYLPQGVQFMLGGSDMSLLMDAAAARRGMIAAVPRGDGTGHDRT